MTAAEEFTILLETVKRLYMPLNFVKESVMKTGEKTVLGSCPACSGSGSVRKVQGMAQLVSTPHGLFAVGLDGNVYVYTNQDRPGWKSVSMELLK